MNVEELFTKIATEILKVQAAAAAPAPKQEETANISTKQPEKKKKGGCSLI